MLSSQKEVTGIPSPLGPAELAELEALAMSNHVILRAFEPLGQIVTAAGNTEAENGLTMLSSVSVLAYITLWVS